MQTPLSPIAEKLAALKKQATEFNNLLKRIEAVGKPKPKKPAKARSHSDCATEQMARDAAFGMLQMAQAATVAANAVASAAASFEGVCETGYQAAETALADCLAS